MAKILMILKRPFCKHKKTAYVTTFLDDWKNGGRVTRHIWKCQKCGKEFVGGYGNGR